jgi:type VI secretion system protein
MARTSFLDKFSSVRKPPARGGLEHVMRNVQALLNTKEGYGYFLPGFGLGGYTDEAGSGGLVEALATEMEEEIRRHEPRLEDVEVTVRGRDSSLWLHFGLSATLEGQRYRLRVLFDTITGQVRLENEEDR